MLELEELEPTFCALLRRVRVCLHGGVHGTFNSRWASPCSRASRRASGTCIFPVGLADSRDQSASASALMVPKCGTERAVFSIYSFYLGNFQIHFQL